MVLKWLFDRSVSLLGLLVLWPVLVVLALLVRRNLPGGPAIFHQQRVGKEGRLFTIRKFRTMPVGYKGLLPQTEGFTGARFAGKLRKYKLDELPQLWNILIGDMSFVGPRPDIPGYADQLTGDNREILRLRPGVTGPASLKYRDEASILAAQADPLRYNDEVIFPDKVRINRYYLHHWSFWMDIRLIVATVTGRHMEYGGEII